VSGPVPVQPVSPKKLCMGHVVAALVPSDMALIGAPLFACPAVCITPGNELTPAVFTLLGTPPVMANIGGQQVALSTAVVLPLQYMGRTKRALGWCWPEEFSTDGLEPAKVH
jgi:hypothetical protein